MDHYLQEFLDDLEDEAGFNDEKIHVHTRARTGDTPLHIASIRGNTRAISLLANYEADLNAQGEWGFTPLLYAIQQGHTESVRLLLKLGANPSLQNQDGDDAWELMQYFPNPEILRLLEENATGQNRVNNIH